MTRAGLARPLVLVPIVLLAGVVLTLSSCLFAGSESARYEGWVEGHFIFVGPDETGRIEKLIVREGDHVEKGSLLFSLDDALQVDDLAEAEAALANAGLAFTRAKDLLTKKVGSEKAFDDAEAAFQTAQARRESAKTRLARRRVMSPTAGTVQEVYFRVGEMVQSARPVLSVLPPNEVRIRFFVPQDSLAGIKIGQKVTLDCDGCEKSHAARITFVSTKAEFTPPVIYSTEERSRLVFRIEARPVEGGALKVGQPVTVSLADGEGT